MLNEQEPRSAARTGAQFGPYSRLAPLTCVLTTLETRCLAAGYRPPHPRRQITLLYFTLGSFDPLCLDPVAAGPSVETDVYRLISHPLQDPSTLREGLAIHKKIAGKCRRPFSDPPGDLIDRWEHRDGRGRAPRANGSDIPFSAIRPISRRGKGVNTPPHARPASLPDRMHSHRDPAQTLRLASTIFRLL